MHLYKLFFHMLSYHSIDCIKNIIFYQQKDKDIVESTTFHCLYSQYMILFNM